MEEKTQEALVEEMVEKLPVIDVDAKLKELDRSESQNTSLGSWVPRTEIGRKVKSGEIKNIDEILSTGKKILESEIIDALVPLETDLLLVGQAKGKFGGGKRRAWRQTQKKSMEGNIPTFSTLAVIGDRLSHVGIGIGRAKETLPAKSKAIREAKLNLIKISRGFESKDDSLKEPHTVPFIVEGKCGSVRLKLIPAPRGTGLVAGEECKKILRLAGIKDVYTQKKGQTRTTINMAFACIDALGKTTQEMIR